MAATPATPRPPTTPREHVPFLIYGDEVKPGVNLHTRYSFATIADTVCKALGVDYCPAGCGVYDEICPLRWAFLCWTCWPQCWSSIRFR